MQSREWFDVSIRYLSFRCYVQGLKFGFINPNLYINNIRYHHAVPREVPVLDTKATYGLVSPIVFQMPSPNSIWNSNVYEVLRSVTTVATSKTEKEQTLPPIKEEAIHQSSKEPKNTSGCALQ